MDTSTPARSQSPAFNAYRLDDRRTDSYTFTSMKGLLHYFSTWLEREEITEVVENSKTGFVRRNGSDHDETQLQMIKKCEYALVRILRKGLR
jgi:hypothetical protein